MWSRKRTQVIQSAIGEVEVKKELVPANVPVPAPTAVQVLADPRTEEYLKVAEEAGVDTHGAAWALRMRHFLAKHEMLEYPMDEVKAYLRDQCVRLGEEWGWRWTPLRERDRITTAIPNYDWETRSNYRPDYGTWRPKNTQPYHLAVPHEALEKVALIQRAFPDAVFFVSEIGHFPKGDPFLAVTTDRAELIVVHEWDEPGYYRRHAG